MEQFLAIFQRFAMCLSMDFQEITFTDVRKTLSWNLDLYLARLLILNDIFRVFHPNQVEQILFLTLFQELSLCS